MHTNVCYPLLARSLHPFSPLRPHTDDLRHTPWPAEPKLDPESTESLSDSEDANGDVVESEPDAETRRQEVYTARPDQGPSVVGAVRGRLHRTWNFTDLCNIRPRNCLYSPVLLLPHLY
jgi:hypothetical protein